jgi:hypothetical protein
MRSSPGRARAWLLSLAAAAGVAVGAAGTASAAAANDSSSTTATTPDSGRPAPPDHPAGDPAAMPNGPGETLLTGDTAEKVKAAALAAVPDGTILRVETDSAGSPYEAHVRKADGSEVTVKVDSGFEVTATEDGFGAGPDGRRPPWARDGGDGPTTSGRDTAA